MNPEQLLEEVSAAIRHRTISTTFKWYIVFYYERICCVPTYVNVPNEIIISEFSEQQVQKGFSVHEWHDIRNKVTWFYKETHK